MYHVSAQSVDEHTINVHYYYDYNVEILLQLKADEIGKGKRDKTATKNQKPIPIPSYLPNKERLQGLSIYNLVFSSVQGIYALGKTYRCST